MVLDAKALTWAAKNDIDTAKLKKAKIPIYGKWYFPEIPPNVALVNLETGEQESFSERMIAGEVIFVPAGAAGRRRPGTRRVRADGSAPVHRAGRAGVARDPRRIARANDCHGTATGPAA